MERTGTVYGMSRRHQHGRRRFRWVMAVSGLWSMAARIPERLCLNEDTLWGGYPQCSQREGMAEVYHRARSLVLEGKKREAQRLLEAEFGDFLIQPYLPLGDVVLEFSHGEETVGYRRELSLKEPAIRCRTVWGIQRSAGRCLFRRRPR